MGMKDTDYATCTEALATLRASGGGPEDVTKCIGVILPIVRAQKKGEKAGQNIAVLLRAGQYDAAAKIITLVAGRFQVGMQCPGCRAMSSWQSPAGCPECGYKPKSTKFRTTMLILTIGPFIALMGASAGAALVPSSFALAAPLVCGAGEEVVTTGTSFSQPDGTRGTNYTNACHGPAGDRPVSTLSMLFSLFAIYLVPGIVVGTPFALLLARRLKTLGH